MRYKKIVFKIIQKSDLTYMTKVKNILGEVLNVETNFHLELSKSSPFRKRTKEKWFVVVQPKIDVSFSDFENFGNVAVGSEICAVHDIHWAWA